jgi:hypothetical protein
LKEQEAEEALYGPKERFVTSSYASVKEARKVAQEEEAKQEEPPPLTLPEVKPSPEKPVPAKILQPRQDVVLP